MVMSLGVIFIVGLVFSGIFKKLKLPSLVGMLITGMIVGPNVLDLMDQGFLENSDELRKIALTIILLRAGLAIDVNVLRKIGKNVIILSIVPAFFEMIIVSVVAMVIFNFDFVNALLLGTVIAAVSPAVVVPFMLRLMENKKTQHRSIPQLIMASASLEDVFVIILFFSALNLSVSQEFNFIIVISLIISIVLGLLGGIILGVVTTIIFRRFEVVDSAKAITLLAISFLFLTLEGYMDGVIKFSGLIAIMTLGVTTLTLNKKDALIVGSKFKEIWVAAEIVLFVLVGGALDIDYAIKGIGYSLIVIAIGLLFRFIGIYVSLYKSKYTWNEKKFIMISFIPKATVQAAIGPVALTMGLASGNVILSVSVTAILITAPLGSYLMSLNQNKILEEI